MWMTDDCACMSCQGGRDESVTVDNNKAKEDAKVQYAID